jgi:hypothetical protein
MADPRDFFPPGVEIGPSGPCRHCGETIYLVTYRPGVSRWEHLGPADHRGGIP